MEHFENLEKAMCKELEKLDKKYGGETGEMSPQDLETADKIYHALKSAATYHAMRDAYDDEGEYSGEGSRRGRSYRRGYAYNGGGSGARSPRTGRFVSREEMYSGGYPMDYLDPYWDRRGGY